MNHISVSAAGIGPLHSKWHEANIGLPSQIHSFFMVRRWNDQHCRRQTPPLPRCLSQPCFKIHDSSFQSVMNGRWCRSGMHGTRTLPAQGHALANLAGRERESHHGSASGSVHQQCGGHSCLATETDHASHLQRTTRGHFDPNVLEST